jgi:hypothetical protein
MIVSVTPSYAAILGLLFLALSLRVIVVRRHKNLGFGTDGDTDLERRIRVHANFAEYVPMTLLLLGMAEIRGAPHLWLHVLNMALLLGRIAHALGVSRPATDSIGRVLGMTGTQSALLGGALLCVLPGLRP